MNRPGAARAQRTPAPTGPTLGIVRGLPNTYEVTEFGTTHSTTPTANWQRGAIVRGAQPVFALAPNTPMYDPTMGPPQNWNK